MTLMIVNDMQPTLQFLQTAIPWPDYGITSVLAADSAQAARRIIKADSIDVILCDIQMPDENGLEFIRWVCEQGFNCECIFLTCHANFEYAHEAIQLGCKDYILFPAPPAQIGQAVQSVVERRTQQQETDRLKQFGQFWLDNKQQQGEMESGITPAMIVDEAVRYIIEHIDSAEINVNMLAQHCNLSTSHFSRLFKKNTGVSINQFIIRERMELAGKLLRTSDILVNTVAEKTGYSNYAYFTSQFKKYHGLTPTQYRDEPPPSD